MQSTWLKEDTSQCSQFSSKLKFAGSIASHFHSVFTDHKVFAKRQKCCNKKCGWTSVPSISSQFNTNSHPDLFKLQTQMACNHTYREAEKLMNAYSFYTRKINNHDHINSVVEIVGNYISEHQVEEVPDNTKHTAELICQVDGGHLKSSIDGQRSFEALTALIYSPQNAVYAEKISTADESSDLPRGKITSKHCAASALDENLATTKRQMLVAALKQGMTADTKIVAV